jgi:hypothetical protein
MKATVRDDDATIARHRRPQPSIDLFVEWRPPIDKGRHPHVVWDVWCDAAVAGAVWLLLFGLALFALSAVARPQPASAPTSPPPSEVVAPEVSEWHSWGADAEIVP